MTKGDTAFSELSPPIEYAISYGANPHMLVAEVNRMTEAGWKLQGGIAVALPAHFGEERWAQALYREVAK